MKKIMLVEDNSLNARLIEHVLTRDDFEVTSFNNAEEAISAAAELLPDIILMDIQLPGMDGLEATRKLKEDPATRSIPIVAITAHAMCGDEDRVMEAGCSGYLPKPINTRELAASINSIIGE